MVRGIVPRQPAKTGRHEGAQVSRSLKTSQKTAGLRPERPGQRPGTTKSKKSAPGRASTILSRPSGLPKS